MQRIRYNNGTLKRMSCSQWVPALRGIGTDRVPMYLLSDPEPVWVDMDDTMRNWSTPYQDIEIFWGETVTDAALTVGGTASGYTVYVNGVSYVPTYRSGSGTSIWIIRIATTVKNGDAVTISYDQSTGASIAAVDSREIGKLTTAGVENDLTKRVRFTLCDSADALVNETVKAALFEYASNTVANDSWMQRANKASVAVTTGQFDMLYSGTANVGSLVFCAVIRTTESMVVAATVT